MRHNSSDSNKLFCFSPPVMLATFLIEFGIALIGLFWYRRTTLGQLAILTLVLLGTFQLAEYQICTTHTDNLWAPIGLVAITLLPPVGLAIISHLTGTTWLTTLGYGLAIVFSLAFVVVPGMYLGATCAGNYVIFQIRPGLGLIYGLYYFGFLFLAILQALRFRATQKMSVVRRATLDWMVCGYLVFIIPMALVYSVSPAARAAVPSIMCGFALLFALILGWKILPLSSTK